MIQIDTSLKNLLTTLAAGCALAVCASSAEAEPTRTPIVPLGALKLVLKSDDADRFELDRYLQTAVHRTERAADQRAVRFESSDTPIPEHAVLVFEAVAVGHGERSRRWSCIAVDRVSQCMGPEGLRLPYRADDRGMELRVTARSMAEPKVHAYVQRFRAMQKGLTASASP
ncbi:MAG TPA: hypothetical protein RMG48_11105 [Myxococcales bacterium LLY-WYZ-16_1]|jgi:hypothetical protein|nr:hypothetical protein [Myxococcales bacterium LLY-WYZ-16_1]